MIKKICFNQLITGLTVNHLVNQKPGTSKTGFGQVKIIKEFVSIIFFFLNLAFEQVGEKIKTKTTLYYMYVM